MPPVHTVFPAHLPLPTLRGFGSFRGDPSLSLFYANDMMRACGLAPQESGRYLPTHGMRSWCTLSPSSPHIGPGRATEDKLDTELGVSREQVGVPLFTSGLPSRDSCGGESSGSFFSPSPLGLRDGQLAASVLCAARRGIWQLACGVTLRRRAAAVRFFFRWIHSGTEYHRTKCLDMRRF